MKRLDYKVKKALKDKLRNERNSDFGQVIKTGLQTTRNRTVERECDFFSVDMALAMMRARKHQKSWYIK